MKSTLLLLATLLSVTASETPFWRAGHLVVGDPVHPLGADMIDIDPRNGDRVRVLPGAVGYSTGLAFSQTGDLFVTDNARGQILVMRNTNNFFEPLSTTPMEKPLGLALTTNGDLYTTVWEPFPAVLRVKADTGEATVVSSGPPLYKPSRVVIGRNGDLFVSNRETPDEVTSYETNDILRIDPNTGAQTVITSSGFLLYAGILAVDKNDNIFVADQRMGVIKVDTTTGKQTLLSFIPATGVTADGRRGAYFTHGNSDTAAVSHFNFSSGSSRTVSTNVALWHPCDITMAPSVHTLVSALVPCEGPPTGPWRSRGDYVSTVVKTVIRLARQGTITPAEGRAALASALASRCGFKPHVR
jgi:sugar lactone lactonase YvrE